jgi:autotransporter-associated beta strand protein
MKRSIYFAAALIAVVAIACPAQAAESDWTGSVNSDFSRSDNWTAGVPSGASSVAGFGSSSQPSVLLSGSNGNSSTVGEILFKSDASAYTLSIDTVELNVNGTGILNLSSRPQNIATSGGGHLSFLGSSSAGGATTISNKGGGFAYFDNTASADHAAINNDGGWTTFAANSTAGHALVNNSNGGTVYFWDQATAANATITNQTGGEVRFYNSARAGNAEIQNSDGAVYFSSHSSVDHALVTNGALGTLTFLDNATAADANLVNNGGTIDISSLTATGLSVGALSGSGTVTAGSKNLTVGGLGLDATLSGVISGNGATLTKIGAGTLTLSGANTYTGATAINAGTLNLTGSLAGNATVAAGAQLSGSGRLNNLVNNGIVTPSADGSGRLRAASYQGPGTLNVTLTNTSHSSLDVSGNANLTGGTLHITDGAPEGQYSVLSAGSVTGNFSTVNTPSSAFLSFATAYTPTDVLVQVKNDIPFMAVAQNGNGMGVASALDSAKTTATGGMANVVDAVLQLNAAQAQSAFAQISGDSLAAYQSVGLHKAAQFSQQMNSRAAPAGFVTASDRSAPVQLAFNGDASDLGGLGGASMTQGIWARGLGLFDHTQADSSIGSPAADATTGGFQAGYDHALGETILVGVSAGYAATNLSVDDRSSSGHSLTREIGLYARYAPNAWFVNGSFAFSKSSNDMSRSIVFPGVNEQADADFGGRAYTTYAEGGYVFKPRLVSAIEPSLSLTQTHLHEDGFVETGAPGLNLTVADQTLDSLVSAVGVRVTQQFLKDSSHPVKLALRGAWQHELNETNNVISAAFADAPGSRFAIRGTPQSRDAASISLDTRVGLTRNLQAFVDYSATLSTHEDIQGILGGLALRW